MSSSHCWLAETWPLIGPHVPAPPARVIELGCGPEGGFVPGLLRAGYDAIGVDPRAPEGPPYLQADFEEAELGGTADAVVACVSLHHVGDLDRAVDHVVDALVPQGTVVVVEWGWERFDEATARWCFDRLPPPTSESDHSWLQHQHEQWEESGLPWGAYLRQWAATEGLHRAADILQALGQRFTRTRLDDLPYFFGDLAGTDRAAEQAAIANGQIRATGLLYVGTAA